MRRSAPRTRSRPRAAQGANAAALSSMPAEVQHEAASGSSAPSPAAGALPHDAIPGGAAQRATTVRAGIGTQVTIFILSAFEVASGYFFFFFFFLLLSVVASPLDRTFTAPRSIGSLEAVLSQSNVSCDIDAVEFTGSPSTLLPYLPSNSSISLGGYAVYFALRRLCLFPSIIHSFIHPHNHFCC